MGYGYWTRESFEHYSKTMGRTVNAHGGLDAALTDRQLFQQKGLHSSLNPANVIRECCDTPEHPESLPVILALDVTGSMGSAAAEVARKLNEVMTLLYEQVKDVEFMVMGIGDLAYDHAPIQISQFESDIRIAEQLDRIYLEHGGGGNNYESYTAAWYMGLYHTRLDCWKRNKKGLIITMGDETLNPYLPKASLMQATGDQLEANVETKVLYPQAAEKFSIYHLHVSHTATDPYQEKVKATFGELLPKNHLRFVRVDTIAQTIVDIVKEHAKTQNSIWHTAFLPPQQEKKNKLIFW